MKKRGTNRKTITVSMPPDMLRMIRLRVSTGRFDSVSDYFRHIVARDVNRVRRGEEPVECRPRRQWHEERIYPYDLMPID